MNVPERIHAKDAETVEKEMALAGMGFAKALVCDEPIVGLFELSEGGRAVLRAFYVREGDEVVKTTSGGDSFGSLKIGQSTELSGKLPSTQLRGLFGWEV